VQSKLATRAGLAVCSALVAFGLCEVAARMVFPAPPDPGRQPQIVYRYDPELRYVLSPNQKGWIDDGLIKVNALGFRGREVSVPKPAGRFRIMVIGDSLTLGWGVGDDETYSAQVERLLPEFQGHDVDVVNGGIGGYNTRQEVAMLKRYVSRLEPDLVLVGFYSNDVPDALEDSPSSPSGGTRIAASHPAPGQVLHMTHGAPNSWWDHQLRKSRAVFTLGRALKRFSGNGESTTSTFSMELDLLEGRESPSLDRAWVTIERQFAELRDLARSAGFSVGIVVLPCREQVTGQYANARYQNRIRSIAQRLGFAVIDPLPPLSQSPMRKDRLFIPYDRNHPSAAGHHIIAQTIVQYLQEHEIRGTGHKDDSQGGFPVASRTP
jgi:lysophospholipase L1-like esterase